MKNEGGILTKWLISRLSIVVENSKWPFGLSVHAFGWTGQENIITTCRSAGNYYIQFNLNAPHYNAVFKIVRPF